jgi:hypothetical protein
VASDQTPDRMTPLWLQTHHYSYDGLALLFAGYQNDFFVALGGAVSNVHSPGQTGLCVSKLDAK